MSNAHEMTRDSCYAKITGDELQVGNALFERRWQISAGRLHAAAFLDRCSGRSWIAGVKVEPSPVPPEGWPEGSFQLTLEARADMAHAVMTPSLVADVRMTGPDTSIHFRMRIYPGVAGVTIQYIAGAAGAQPTPPVLRNNKPPETSTGIEAAPTEVQAALATRDVLESLKLDAVHLALTQVRLVDQTDIHGNLVFESSWDLCRPEAELQLQGNLFFVEDRLTGEGLAFVKHAPLPHVRPVKSPVDCVTQEHLIVILGHGAADGFDGYAWTTMCYSGGRDGRTRVMHALQRAIRPALANRDGMFISNTWGDRSRDSRICEEFILREIEAGAALGVDIVQIDDGWQRGITSNSVVNGGVWEGFWAANANFWQPHETRFPRGLSAVVKAASSKNVRIGLWFSPDAAADYSNWRRDADQILLLHREHGIGTIKIDGVKARSKPAEANLRRFFDAVLFESAGRVTFDLDITAEVRPGYFGMMDVGPLFIENRYTDWHRYWPHATLRNFWELLRYIDPLRLRMELLNNTRNQQLYPGDPLAPARYSPDYLFASVMLGSPLGWFETSSLSAEYVAALEPVVRAWKLHRAEMSAGQTLPIGQSPDGTQWAGFLNVNRERTGGHLLLFRELNEEPQWQTRLNLPADSKWKIEKIAGSGELTLASGSLDVTIPQPLQYLWVRFGLR